jgi:hypothetical protein
VASRSTIDAALILLRRKGRRPLASGFDPGAAPFPGRSRDLTVRDIGPFLLLTFAMSWGLVALMIAWPERVEALLGEIGLTNPAYLLAVWAPAVVAFALILRRSGGAGLHRQFVRCCWSAFSCWSSGQSRNSAGVPRFCPSFSG